MPIALEREIPHEIKRQDTAVVKVATEANVMLGGLMWLDLAKRILQDHNTSQEYLGPLDDKLDIEVVHRIIAQGPPKLKRKPKRSMPVSTQKVQWKEKPKKQGPKVGPEAREWELEPFEEGPPSSLHQARQVWFIL
jgi:hypothetical protein